MISDRERREAARELRAMDMTDIEENGCILDSPKYVGLLLMRMLDAVCDYRPGLHYFPSHFSAQAVVELFADLIDRPTCVMTDIGDEFEQRYVCSGCHSEFDMSDFERFPYRYCPNCGAEVVDD